MVSMRFSTADIAEHERVPAWRDYWGRRVFGADAIPMTDTPFAADVTVRALPGLRVLTTDTSPLRVVRTAKSTVDGTDCLGLVVCTSRIDASQSGKEISLAPGEATLLSTGDASVLESRETAKFRCLLVDRHMLPLAPNLDITARLRVPASDPLLRLLFSYVDILLEDTALGAAELDLGATHMRELLGLLLSRDGDTRDFADSLSAARLARLRRFIAQNFADPGVSIHDAARHLGLSVRSIQRLFAAGHTSFTDDLLDRRLDTAYRALADPRLADQKISDIALGVGFSDISYFNRCFRQRFGCRPTDVRDR